MAELNADVHVTFVRLPKRSSVPAQHILNLNYHFRRAVQQHFFGILDNSSNSAIL